MGFLTEGDTLPWQDAKQYADYIRKHGIEQFLSIYFRTKERTNDALLWGDEVCVELSMGELSGILCAIVGATRLPRRFR
jgi:hypothetical protein